MDCTYCFHPKDDSIRIPEGFWNTLICTVKSCLLSGQYPKTI